MYTLYIGNKNYSSWSLRPWVLLRALGIPFEERLVPFEEGANWKRFRDFSQSGLVPCLHDGDTAVWDSLAIAEYVAEAHAGVWPRDRATRAWARSVVCEMHSGFFALRSQCPMNCGIRVELDNVGKALRSDLHRVDEIFTEGQLQYGGPFLAGRQFTAADAFFAPVAFRVQSYGLKPGARAAAYVQQMLTLPAMREWYEAALAEPWREAHHEAEASEGGRIVQDLRRPAPPA